MMSQEDLPPAQALEIDALGCGAGFPEPVHREREEERREMVEKPKFLT